MPPTPARAARDGYAFWERAFYGVKVTPASRTAANTGTS